MPASDTCRTCGAELGPAAATGRPAAYCSVPCRRQAEYSLKRINGYLARTEWERDLLRRRLALDDVPGYTRREQLRNRERLEQQLAVLDADVDRYLEALDELLRR